MIRSTAEAGHRKSRGSAPPVASLDHTPQLVPARLTPETPNDFESQTLHDLRQTAEQAQAEAGAIFAADGSVDDRAPSERLAAPLRAPESTIAGQASSRSGEIEELMTRLLEKMQAGEDARGRKTLVLHIDAGTQGRVAVRMKRDGDGYNVRLRPSDPDFARRLEDAQGDLRRSASKRGLRFTQIDVVM